MESKEFCEKIKEFEGAMYALSFSILKNDTDCADAIADAIMSAYTNLDKLKNKDSFKGWLLKIVHHKSIDVLKKRHNSVDIDEQYDLSDQKESMENTQTKIALWDAVESLKQPYRTVITLFYYEDLAVIDIAKITGTTEGNIKKQLSRGRDMLREILSKEDFF